MHTALYMDTYSPKSRAAKEKLVSTHSVDSGV